MYFNVVSWNLLDLENQFDKVLPRCIYKKRDRTNKCQKK